MADRTGPLAVWSWAIYDFANTIFSVGILTVYFPLWVDEALGSGAWLVNAATAVSALLVVATAPALGAVGDLQQRRVPYLILFTAAAVALTAGLDLAGGVAVGVALFVAADVTYQSALVFYNALLPAVSVGRGAGKVSGYGTAAGYVGTILALLVLASFVDSGGVLRAALGPLGGWIAVDAQTSSNAFLPTAVLYLIFSIPAFFFVPDPAVRRPRPVALGSAYRDVFATLKGIRAYGGVGPFILATIFYTDAANTAVANMALYGREVFGMDGGEIRNLLLFSTVFAIVGSALTGVLTDRIGPKKTLLGVLVLWLVAIVLSAIAPGPWMLFLAGPLVGVALGGTWTVGRVMLVALSPPEKLGEFFGLFTFAGRLSAVMGPALTAFLLLVFSGLGHFAYRLSIGLLAVLMALGIALLMRVPDVRAERSVEEYATVGKPSGRVR